MSIGPGGQVREAKSGRPSPRGQVRKAKSERPSPRGQVQEAKSRRPGPGGQVQEARSVRSGPGGSEAVRAGGLDPEARARRLVPRQGLEAMACTFGLGP